MIDIKDLEIGDKANFETLCRAFDSGDAVLVPTTRKNDGSKVSLVCAVSIIDGEEGHCLIPLAIMVEDNPYETFNNPTD